MDMFDVFSVSTFVVAIIIWNEVVAMRKAASAAQQSAQFKLEDIASALGDLSTQVDLIAIQQKKTQEETDRASS